MTEVHQTPKLEQVSAVSLGPQLRAISVFSGISDGDLACMGTVDLVHAEVGSDLFSVSRTRRAFWILLEGDLRLQKREADNTVRTLATLSAGETFGEVPLLTGKDSHVISVVLSPVLLVHLKEEAFWNLMFACPHVRTAILGNMARRLQVYQSEALHRETLISLGTLAAGLMHELNNPGAAARRAASQMRENLGRLQQLSLRFCSGQRMSPGQVECLRVLQEQAFQSQRPKVISSLEQADAEEHLAEWLEAQGIENSWKLAGTLTEIGVDSHGLECAQKEFPGHSLSDPLNWMDALISSVQLVGTIEESVSRVTELVHAVKKYAYEDKGQRHQIDVHDSIQSTLVILGHKLRQKELTVEKHFTPGLPPVSTCGAGLNQVWTNLLDNAIDAAPQKGHIGVRTWQNGSQVCIAVTDDGPGISDENKKRIFEPFFTTKPAGYGTGLGLDIVHRIVVGQFSGTVQLQSTPGKTEFVVSVPITS